MPYTALTIEFDLILLDVFEKQILVPNQWTLNWLYVTTLASV